MILFYFIATSLFIFGVKSAFSEGMILEPIKISFIANAGGLSNNAKRFVLVERVCKVLFDCPPCMSSFYGSISYLSFSFDNWGDLLYLPIFVFCLCGFNSLVIKFYNR